MANIYYVNNGKIENYGELQDDFNVSLVLDGTKDSSKVSILNFNGVALKPYTLMNISDIEGWFCVSNDKVERYINENNTFLYKHTLTLVGAIELLNARDLTNCAFNQNTYTIRGVLERLFDLSSLGLPANINNLTSAVDLTEKVDYVKTYANCTLLSAIRDFLNGYNCDAKLSVHNQVVGNEVYMTGYTLNIISKVGRKDLDIINESYFDDVRETKSINKSSYGTSVVSNAENVISNDTKIYPSMGGVRLSANQYNLTRENAILRLPTKVHSVEWVKMSYNVAILCTVGNIISLNTTWEFDNSTTQSLHACYKRFAKHLAQKIYDYYYQEKDYDTIYNELLAQQENVLMPFNNGLGTATFYTGARFDPSIDNQNWVAPNNDTFKFTPMLVYDGTVEKLGIVSDNGKKMKNGVVLVSEEEHTSQPQAKTSFSWSRGKDYLSHFDFLGDVNSAPKNNSTFLLGDDYGSAEDTSNTYATFYMDEIGATFNFLIKFTSVNGVIFRDVNLTPFNTRWQVKYTPMSDIKIKYDNENNEKDIHLYNQNGKLTDSMGLSKKLVSYVKEISSDTITRYKTLYSLENAPKIGQLVLYNGEKYVINNISLDVRQNENGYCYFGEFTMSKLVAIKSLMVNPNTNIRDYGIPQDNTVRRLQLYRDYYELSIENETDIYSPYRSISTFFNTSGGYSNSSNNLALMKITYGELVDGRDSWYYQLEPIEYQLARAYYEVIDFKDNNIIGYGAMNTTSAFTIENILKDKTRGIITPISYVDDKGRFKDIDIAFTNINEVVSIYADYVDKNCEIYGIENFNENIYNYSAFIPSDVYEGFMYNGEQVLGAKDRAEFVLSISNYNKDALEIPVIEYACEINGGKKVSVGDNIIKEYENCFYLDFAVIGDRNKMTVLNALSYLNADDTPYYVEESNSWWIPNGVALGLNDKTLTINYNIYSVYYNENGQFLYGGNREVENNKDIGIIRFVVNKETNEIVAKNVLFVFTPQRYEGSETDTLYFNYYKTN